MKNRQNVPLDDNAWAALPFALFVVLSAVLSKSVMLVSQGLAQGLWRGLLDVLLSLGADFVLAASTFSLLLLFSQRCLRRVLLSLALSLSLFNAANVVSFHLTGSAINWTRVRGGDGAKITDVDLVQWSDVWPGLAVLVVVLFLALLLLRNRPWWHSTRARYLSRPRHALVLWFVAALTFLGQVLWPSSTLYGLAEYPPLAFVESIFEHDMPVATAEGNFDWRSFLTSAYPGQEVEDQAPRWLGPPPKNVILYFAEGTPLNQTSLGNCPRDTTPNLKKRAAHGLFFTRYYAPYAKSIHAIFSAACSEFPPPHHLAISKFNPRIDCGTFIEHLADKKIAQGLFHGGHFSFGGKMKFLGGRGFSKTVDAYDIIDKNKNVWSSSWGTDDRAMVDAGLDWMRSLKKDQRFFAWFIPIAPHYPYAIPPDVKKAFVGKDRETRYQNAVHFADQAFERLMQGLEAQGIADDTLVIWLADHGEAFGEHPRNAVGSRFIYEENVHVPMVWINRRMFATAQRSARLASHVDLGPTIMDIFGAAPDPRHRGHSLLMKKWPPQRAILAAYQGRDAYVGFVEGSYKYIHRISDGHNEYYKLSVDPLEQHDLSATFSKRMNVYGKLADQYQLTQLSKLRNYPRLSDQPEDFVQAMLPELSARVLPQGQKKWRGCDKRDKAGHLHCAGQPGWVYLGARQEKIEGRTTSCVRAHIPKPGGIFEVQLRPRALQMSSGLRIALCDGSKKKGGDDVDVQGGWIRAGQFEPDHALDARLRDKGASVHFDWPDQRKKNARFALRFSAGTANRRCMCLIFNKK